MEALETKPLLAGDLDFLRSIDLFKAIDSERLGAISSHMRRIELKQGSTLFRQGDPGDSIFVVISGQ